jgi:hypothetical protein
MKQMPISRALLNVPSGVPVKEPSLQVPFMEPLERDSPFLEPSLHLSKSLVYEPLPRFLSGAPMERDAHLKAFSIYPSGPPARKPCLQVPLTELPEREMLHLQGLFQPSLLVPGR